MHSLFAVPPLIVKFTSVVGLENFSWGISRCDKRYETNFSGKLSSSFGPILKELRLRVTLGARREIKINPLISLFFFFSLFCMTDILLFN